MKQLCIIESALALGMVVASAPPGWGREAQRASALSAQASPQVAAAVETQDQVVAGPARVRAGSKIQAELESAVDARTVKPGDRVTARVTHNLKDHGRVVIHKGDQLAGHITAADSGASARGGSRLVIAFDQLVSDERTFTLNTVVSSIYESENEAQVQQDLFNNDPASRSAVPPAGAGRAASSSGGLLGSAGSTAGPMMSSAGSAAGEITTAAGASASGASSALGNVGGAIQSTTQTSAGTNSSAGLATPTRSIRLSSQAQAGQHSGFNSVFTTRRGDLRLDSGTRLEFKVSASGDAPRSPKLAEP